MAFYGDYGSLSTIEIAQATLEQIAAKYTPGDLERIDDFEINRTLKSIEAAQMVIKINGGVIPHSWLPMLYVDKKYKK